MDQTPTPAQTPIQLAAEAVGGQKQLAEAINVSQSLAWQWLNGRRPVAAHHCRAIETATGGAVTRHQLRPDVFGIAPAEQVA